MNSETTMVAEQCRLQEWAAQIMDCQNRPAGMSVVEWCACNGITKANYYYRLRRVRKACLESISQETSSPADCTGRTDAPAAEGKNLRKACFRAGYLHKGVLHPCHGRNTPAAACRSPGGDEACSMMPPASKQFTLSPAIPICVPAWTVWRQSLNRRQETCPMWQIPCIFSAEGAQTVSKDLCGKGTAGCCCIRGYQKAGSSGRAALTKYAC